MAAACEALMFVGLIATPPPEYDRPYHGQLYIIERPVAEIDAICCGGSASKRGRAFACAIPMPGHCVIFLPRVEPGGVSKPQQERFKRHEIGHCNGWPADHAGGRY